ncbi:MAG: hypothetical protein LBS58_04705 [Coriobacteriales bacterium]|jgi:hypothetical protein|nr:hypothetical protein [Coriobacteriales bacterium]
MAKPIKQKDMNFLAILDKRANKKPLGLGAVLVPVAFIALLVLGGFYYWQAETAARDLQATAKDIQSYLDNPHTQDQVDLARRARSEAGEVRALADTVAVPVENLATYPDITSAALGTIFYIASWNVELSDFSYDRETGQLSFLATCDYATGVPIFVGRLRSCGVFDDVTYDGYDGTVTKTREIIVTGKDGATSYETESYETFAFYVLCNVAHVPPAEPEPGSEAATGETAGEVTAASEAVRTQAASSNAGEASR